jgi:hypothetical protein
MIIDWFNSLGLKKSKLPLNTNFNMHTSMTVNASVVRRYTNLEEKVDDLQSQVNLHSEQLSNLQKCLKDEISSISNENNDKLENLTQKIRNLFLGNLSLEIFGCFLIMYGVLYS